MVIKLRYIVRMSMLDPYNYSYILQVFETLMPFKVPGQNKEHIHYMPIYGHNYKSHNAVALISSKILSV